MPTVRVRIANPDRGERRVFDAPARRTSVRPAYPARRHIAFRAGVRATLYVLPAPAATTRLFATGGVPL
ncbi:hypothetical protein G6F62_015923 [Rhizopus arrhizus]|nr:hypothetical protein G6F62_015923 [Rhizopus arrhizus]